MGPVEFEEHEHDCPVCAAQKRTDEQIREQARLAMEADRGKVLDGS